VLFWSLWVFYFLCFGTSQSLFSGTPLKTAVLRNLFSTLFSLPFDMTFCYVVLYFILPRYFFKEHYFKGFLLSVLLAVTISSAFLLVYHNFLVHFERYLFNIKKPPNPMTATRLLYNTLYNFLFFSGEGFMAAFVRIAKMWYVKKQESELLSREKEELVSAAANGVIQPIFLVNSLDHVQYMAVERPQEVPGMIRMMKDLLLFTVYDSSQPTVLVSREMKALQQYVELERTGKRGPIDISLSIVGNPATGRIAPFILLPVVSNSFRQLSLMQLDKKYIDVQLTVSAGELLLTIAWSKPADTSTLINGGNTLLQHIQNRLRLIYPANHQFKVIIEPETMKVMLGVNLDRAVNH
jgi:Histidine kinase